MIKFVQSKKDNKILCKQGRKIIAYIGETEKQGYYYAFGKPSGQYCNIYFYGNHKKLTLEEAKNRVVENMEA